MDDEDFPARPERTDLEVSQEEIEWLQGVIDARRRRVERGDATTSS